MFFPKHQIRQGDDNTTLNRMERGDKDNVANTNDEGIWTRIGGSDNDLQKESGEGRIVRERGTIYDEWGNFKTTEDGRVEISNTELGTEGTQLQRQQSILREKIEGRQTNRSDTQDLSNRGRCKTELRLGGMVDGVSYWLDEPRGVPRITIDQQDRANRLKALGNAIVPFNAKLIGIVILGVPNCAFIDPSINSTIE